jgi:hypothetical protein
VRTLTPAALAVAAGVALSALPALPWYAVRSPSVDRTASGLAGSGELWILPLLGLTAVAVGLILAFGAPREPEVVRGHGVLLVALAALAAFWCVRNLVDPPARLLLIEGSPAPVAAPVPAPIALEPAALAAPVVIGILAVAGLALARPQRAGRARRR